MPPTFQDERGLHIEAGRHLVVEALSDKPFIPNQTDFNDKDIFMMITGPNMGGKSTYMRQIAHIVILACMGSFVPAMSVNLDRLIAFSPVLVPAITSTKDNQLLW